MLYVGVPIAESIDLNGGQLLTLCLWTLPNHQSLNQQENVYHAFLINDVKLKTLLESLENPRKNPDIITKKSDKGKSVIIVDKMVYLEKMSEMPDVSETFHTRTKTLQFLDFLNTYINMTSLTLC